MWVTHSAACCRLKCISKGSIIALSRREVKIEHYSKVTVPLQRGIGVK